MGLCSFWFEWAKFSISELLQASMKMDVKLSTF